MSIKRLILYSLTVLLALPPVAAGAAPVVTCEACLVVEADGTELFARRASQRRAIASTTKMVTALLVWDDATPDEPVSVSATAAGTPHGGLHLEAGETYTVEELLLFLLLASSNDAAVALAEHVSGSEEAFVVAMNAFVAAQGLDDTAFATAHGLDHPGHYSSARDLAAIGALLLEVEGLAEMVGRAEVVVGGRIVQNRNLLLEGYDGATGIKTGYTLQAGNVLVASAERDGRRLIAVAMGSQDHSADAAALLDHGFATVVESLLVAEGTALGGLFWPGAGAVRVTTGAGVSGPHDPGSVSLRLRPAAPLGAGIRAGARLGTVIVLADGERVGRSRVVADGSLTPPEELPLAVRVLVGMLQAVAALSGRA